jgi:hypothetical protein
VIPFSTKNYARPRTPMKSVLIQCFALLCAIHLYADEAYVDSLKHSPWLTPEMCALQSPEFFFDIRANEQPRKLDVNASEVCQDAFFEAYADNLATVTDQHYPLATKIRRPLYDAFAAVFEFISDVNGHSGVSHYDIRLPARVEWQIYTGFKNNFAMAFTGRYSIGDLRTVARLYQRAYGHESFRADNPDPLTTHFEVGIKKLQEAEALLPEDAVYHFRTQMMGMFGQFLGR